MSPAKCQGCDKCGTRPKMYVGEEYELVEPHTPEARFDPRSGKPEAYDRCSVCYARIPKPQCPQP